MKQTILFVTRVKYIYFTISLLYKTSLKVCHMPEPEIEWYYKIDLLYFINLNVIKNDVYDERKCCY